MAFIRVPNVSNADLMCPRYKSGLGANRRVMKLVGRAGLHSQQSFTQLRQLRMLLSRLQTGLSSPLASTPVALVLFQHYCLVTFKQGFFVSSLLSTLYHKGISVVASYIVWLLRTLLSRVLTSPSSFCASVSFVLVVLLGKMSTVAEQCPLPLQCLFFDYYFRKKRKRNTILMP